MPKIGREGDQHTFHRFKGFRLERRGVVELVTRTTELDPARVVGRFVLDRVWNAGHNRRR